MSDIDDDEYLIDYSTILSNTTTNVSFNNTASSANRVSKSETLQTTANTTIDFTQFNPEFVNMGFESILTDKNNIDQSAMAKNLRRLLTSFQNLRSKFDQTQSEYELL